MQRWHFVLDNGKEITMTCKNSQLTRHEDGNVSVTWDTPTDVVPVKIGLDDCKFVWYEQFPNFGEKVEVKPDESAAENRPGESH